MLRPAVAAQPASKDMKYEHVKSAMAEEGLLSLILLEPNLMDLTGDLSPEEFSAPLLGRVYGWMRQRWQEGLSISIPAMEPSFQPEEISHITKISQKQEGVVSERALGDYIEVIRSEAGKRGSKDLMAALDRCRDKKGYGG
jgi:DNA primase